jgi:hypothetical protein
MCNGEGWQFRQTESSSRVVARMTVQTGLGRGYYAAPVLAALPPHSQMFLLVHLLDMNYVKNNVCRGNFIKIICIFLYSLFLKS